MADYERQEREHSPAFGWMVVAGFCALLLAIGLATWLITPNGSRDWDYGTLEDVPGASHYSTSQPDVDAPAPRQMPPLPEPTGEDDS